jgi:hypothetical protein
MELDRRPAATGASTASKRRLKPAEKEFEGKAELPLRQTGSKPSGSTTTISPLEVEERP